MKLTRLRSPVYAMAFINDDTVVLGGGGGSSRTGVKNRLVSRRTWSSNSPSNESRTRALEGGRQRAISSTRPNGLLAGTLRSSHASPPSTSQGKRRMRADFFWPIFPVHVLDRLDKAQIYSHDRTRLVERRGRTHDCRNLASGQPCQNRGHHRTPLTRQCPGQGARSWNQLERREAEARHKRQPARVLVRRQVVSRSGGTSRVGCQSGMLT